MAKFQCWIAVHDSQVGSEVIDARDAYEAARDYGKSRWWEQYRSSNRPDDCIEIAMRDENGVEYEATVDVDMDPSFDVHVSRRKTPEVVEGKL